MNPRNEASRKTVRTETSKLTLVIPRDRAVRFDAKLIDEYKRRFPGFGDKIVSTYARHGGARDPQAPRKTVRHRRIA